MRSDQYFMIDRSQAGLVHEDRYAGEKDCHNNSKSINLRESLQLGRRNRVWDPQEKTKPHGQKANQAGPKEEALHKLVSIMYGNHKIVSFINH